MAGEKENVRPTALASATEANGVETNKLSPTGSQTTSTSESPPVSVQGEGKLDSQKDIQRDRTVRRQRDAVGMLDRSLQQRIGEILRESFSDIEQEPLPERLNKLVQALRARETRR